MIEIFNEKIYTIGQFVGLQQRLKRKNIEYSRDMLIQDIIKQTNFIANYCIDCDSIIFPKLSKDLSLYYKVAMNKFTPIRCDDCVSILKTNFNYKDKSNEIAMLRYGEEYWKYRWESQDTSSLKFFQSKYGKEKGFDKFQEKNKKTCGSLERYVVKYGEDEGQRRYNSFANKCINSLEKYINKYGEIKGKIEYEKYIHNKKETSKWSIEYWLLECKGNITQAKIKQSEYNRYMASLDKQIDLYGEEKGSQRYLEIQSKKNSFNLIRYIDLYGEELGQQYYNDHYDRIYKNRYSIQWFINRYGEEGEERYLKQHHNFLQNSYSKVSQELFWELYDRLPKFLQEKTYFAELNREFHKMDLNNNKSYFYDFVISSKKLCIEFNGDVFHANPVLFKEDDTPSPYDSDLTSKQIWEKDKNKNKILEDQNFKILIVWELEFKENREKIIDKAYNFLIKE